jgi:hypothetical protein
MGITTSLYLPVRRNAQMHNGPKRKRTRPPRPAASFAVGSKSWKSSAVRSEPKHSQNAQRNYERYLALARAEALIGNTVGAENYYQHAEHYFRSMT